MLSDTYTCKYRKYIKNNKFSKVFEEGKEGHQEDRKFRKDRKSNKNFLVINKVSVTNIATTTNLTKFSRSPQISQK